MIPLTPPPTSDIPWPQRLAAALRNPRAWLESLTGDGPVLALLVLTGLNAVDELSRASFSVVAPTIADHFGVGLTGVTVPFVVAFAAAFALSVPVATMADRRSRVRLALIGGTIFAVCSGLVGLSPSVWVLAVFLAGSNIGKAFIEPSHTSLLADYYAVHLRPRVFSVHRAGNAVGAMVGGVGAGYVASAFGWRAPFFLFAVPTVLLVLVGAGLKEPIRGAQERRLAGGDADSVRTEEEPPSLAEGWRMCWQIDSLRRIYRTLPFLTPAVAGFGLFSSFMYRDVFGLDEAARGWVVGMVEGPSQLVGLAVGARLGMKLFAKDPRLVFGLLAKANFVVTAAVLVFAWAPHPLVAVAAHVLISTCLAFILPGVLATLSIAIPPRARSLGFAMAAVFVLAGMVMLPLVASIGDTWGMRWGITVMTPMFLVGGLVIASAGDLILRDVQQVWAASAARSEVLHQRRAGRAPLLLARDLEVSYGDVQVLFGVDFEIEEGQIVALLGTNGAGKSTLLKSIAGLVPANKGTVILDGRDITYAPAHEVTPRGVVLVPGGQGTFPSLTVAENLRAAAWLDRRRKAGVAERREEVLGTFPELRARLGEPAADLSGGQQQMLSLAMAFISRPRLLLIDELSLGLAPVVVERLVDVVREVARQGTTVVVVEQSVNVALTMASDAYFMEKGEIRFHGATEDLLARPDVLRSVFLEGAASAGGAAAAPGDRDGAGVPSDSRADLAVPTDATATAIVAGRVAAAGNGDRPVGVAGPSGDGATGDGATGDGATGDGAMGDDAMGDGATGDGATGDGVRGSSPARSGPAPLEAIELTRSFGGIRAVDGVSLAVGPGEILGIVGPNGAGKTTLFDLLSGYLPAERGKVLLAGRNVTGQPADARARRGLGRSFQDARLFPGLTVEQCIAVALDRWVAIKDPFQPALHLPAAFDAEQTVRLRVDELIELLGLQAFRDKFIHELSTGSRRIVDLACLVAHRPTVILLDEPSSGIAQREAEALVPLLTRIRDQLGASLVVIEHDMSLVTTVSDRMVALDQGRVIAQGPPGQVLADPAVVVAYLGSNDAVVRRSGSRAGVATALASDRKDV